MKLTAKKKTANVCRSDEQWLQNLSDAFRNTCALELVNCMLVTEGKRSHEPQQAPAKELEKGQPCMATVRVMASGHEEKTALFFYSKSLLPGTFPQRAEKLKINLIFRPISHSLSTLMI